MSSPRTTSALMFLSVALVSAAFVPVFRASAVVWWCAGLVTMLAALVVAGRSSRRRDARPSRRFPPAVAVPLGITLVTSLAAFGIVPGDARIPDVTFDPQLKASSPLEVSREVADLGPASINALQSLASAADELEPVAGSVRAALVRAAEASGYQPRSGLDADYAGASSFRATDGSTVVRVPLLGTDLGEVSAVTFVHLDGVVTVHEISAMMLDASHVAVQVWQDGAQTTNVVLQEPEDAGTPMTRGLSWSKLNTCLANAGISWAIIAVIGVTCAAACAAVVACGACISVAAGFTSGTITACVTKAWT